MTPALFDRADYPTLRDAVYLNQASLGLVGRPAVTAMHDLLDRVARHGNVHMTDEDEAAFFDRLREGAARLLEVDASRVTITSGASELLGQAPFLLAPHPGSTVVVVATDFPAITRPWLRLAAEGECRVEFVEDRPGSDLTDDLVARVDQNTSVVAVGWVQYATGTVVGVPRLRAASNEVGASLVLDVTQGAGAMPLRDWDADLVVSSGYKWLGGHGGVAIGCLSPQLATAVPPLPGWMGSTDPFHFDATRLSVAPDARRFTQSTMSYLSVVGLSTSLDRILAVGVDNVEEHARALHDHLLEEVSGRGWRPFRESSDPAAAPHIVALGLPEGGAGAVVARLRAAGIVCSSRLDRVRVSLAAYNDESDVAALAAALS